MPRTSDDWMASYVMRSDVNHDSTFIVDNSYGKIIAYAVVSNTGKVYELALSPESDKEFVISMLLSKIESYAKEQGANRVSISVPADDLFLKKSFANSGYGRFHSYMVGGILNYPEIIKKTVEQNILPKQTRLNGNFLIKLTNGNRRIPPPFPCDEISIRIENDTIIVEPYKISYPKEVIINIDFFTFTDIIIGKRSVINAFFHRELKISPFWKSQKAMDVLNLMVLSRKWFIPFGDVR